MRHTQQELAHIFDEDDIATGVQRGNAAATHSSGWISDVGSGNSLFIGSLGAFGVSLGCMSPLADGGTGEFMRSGVRSGGFSVLVEIWELS